jgi:hypothetical protein
VGSRYSTAFDIPLVGYIGVTCVDLFNFVYGDSTFDTIDDAECPAYAQIARESGCCEEHPFYDGPPRPPVTETWVGDSPLQEDLLPRECFICDDGTQVLVIDPNGTSPSCDDADAFPAYQCTTVNET